MPPPPIPVRKEGGHTGPPPIPTRTEEAHPGPPPIPARTEEAHPEPPPIPVHEEEAQPEPKRSSTSSPPRWRPAGAVATVMASEQGWRPSGSRAEKGEHVEQQEDEEAQHSTNPYDLKAASGSIVTASYPFHGDADLQQLSFTVGDMIKVKQKEEMWSWGVLERGGAEGWFPHNYVGSTFKPLPGIHEMAAKLKERRERLEGVAASVSAATSGAPDSTLPGSADASGTGLPGNGDSSGTAGTDGQGGASGGDPNGGGEGGEDGKLKAVGEPEEGAEGVDGADRANASGHAHGESSGGVSETGEMNKSASQELLRKKSTDGADGEDKPPSSSDTPAARATAAAPSLPPFLKGGGNVSEVVTPAVVVTQRAPEATKGSEVVSATPIEGVGYAGAAIEPNPKCKCCIM
ncbi:unnamed protein product [Laminaria digitata]